MVIFAHMEHNIHEGEKLRELVLSITTVEKLAEKIGKHRNTVSNWFKEVSLDADKLLIVGKGLRYDLTHLFPKKLKNHPGSQELHYFNEDPAPYFKNLKDVQDMVSKQNQLEADYSLQVNMLQDKINDLKQIISDKNDLLDSKNQIIDMLQKEINELKSGAKSA